MKRMREINKYIHRLCDAWMYPASPGQHAKSEDDMKQYRNYRYILVVLIRI